MTTVLSDHVPQNLLLIFASSYIYMACSIIMSSSIEDKLQFGL